MYNCPILACSLSEFSSITTCRSQTNKRPKKNNRSAFCDGSRRRQRLNGQRQPFGYWLPDLLQVCVAKWRLPDSCLRREGGDEMEAMRKQTMMNSLRVGHSHVYKHARWVAVSQSKKCSQVLEQAGRSDKAVTSNSWAGQKNSSHATSQNRTLGPFWVTSPGPETCSSKHPRD